MGLRKSFAWGALSKLLVLLPLTTAFFLCFSVGLPPSVAEGRMTGGGAVFSRDGIHVTHGFVLHCNVIRRPNHLEINWLNENSFHLEMVTSAACFNNPIFESGNPVSPMDTIFGRGIGRMKGAPASAEWVFTDAGEPGVNDTVRVYVWDANGDLILAVTPDTRLSSGNHQAHKESGNGRGD